MSANDLVDLVSSDDEEVPSTSAQSKSINSSNVVASADDKRQRKTRNVAYLIREMHEMHSNKIETFFLFIL